MPDSAKHPHLWIPEEEITDVVTALLKCPVSDLV
jgi:hypothetical protein